MYTNPMNPHNFDDMDPVTTIIMALSHAALTGGISRTEYGAAMIWVTSQAAS